MTTTKARRIGRLIKDTIFDFIDGDASMLSAALSFFAMLALSPLLLIVLAFASVIYDEASVRLAILVRVEARVGPQAAALVTDVLDHMRGPDSIKAAIIGLLLTLYATTRLFVHLQESLNHLWGVPRPPPMPLSAALRLFLHQRLLSCLMLLAVGILMVAVLVMPAIEAAITSVLGSTVPGEKQLFRLGRAVATLGLLTVFIAALYKGLPDVRLAWRDVWIGAAGTAVLFVAAQAIIGLYFRRTSPGTPYGAAGSLAVLLLWVYYQAQVFFLGAHFTHRYVMEFGASRKRSTSSSAGLNAGDASARTSHAKVEELPREPEPEPKTAGEPQERRVAT